MSYTYQSPAEAEFRESFFAQGVYTCVRCHIETHEHETTRHWVGGEDVCQDCIKLCPICGEYVSDDYVHLGAAVRYRRWEMDGKLSEPTHADCAASDILGDLAGKPLYADDLSREEIDWIMQAGFGRAA